jgi:hypothetical protein
MSTEDPVPSAPAGSGPGATDPAPGGGEVQSGGATDHSEYNRVVAMAVVVIFAVAALIVLLGEDERRAVSLAELPRCTAPGVPEPCLELVPAEVLRQAYGQRQEKGGVRRTKTVELRQKSDGGLLVAHLRSELYWNKFDQGGPAEVAVFAGKVVQVRYRGEVGDTLDNPLIRGRRNLLFIGALVVAGVLVAFDLRRRKQHPPDAATPPVPSAAPPA